MTDFYLAPNGQDANSGTLTAPWATLNRVIAESRLAVPGNAPVAHLQPGTYAASRSQLLWPATIKALEPGVIVEPTSVHSAWTPVLLDGLLVWHAMLVYNATRLITQACWLGADQTYHRVPVWHPASPLDTPLKWAAAVLGPNNPHTRWGLYSTTTDVYLIPPATWTDPNTVRILTACLPAFSINGPDVTLDGLELAGHGIRLDASAAHVHVWNVTTDCADYGVSIYGQASPIVYGHDHFFELGTVRDNGTHVKDGDAPPAPGQGISWNLVKADVDLGIRDSTGKPLLVHKALGGSETVAFYTSGGALNTVVQDYTFDGTFDGASHYAPDSRFDARCDTGLTFRRCTFRNHADDALDRSRYQNGVIVEDSTFHNVGTVLSPAPLWGDVTLRRCQGWRIGDQARIADGLGNKPPGSIIKCGAVDSAHRQGTAHISNCIFWSDNPTTQGISQDGGTGARGPKLDIKDSTLRAGYIAVNWPYSASDFVDVGNTWATSGARPLKTALPIVLTPVADVDARYYSPGEGDFSLMAIVTDLQAQIAALQDQLAKAQAVIQAVQTAVAQAA